MSKPQRSELDADLRRFTTMCWERLRMPGTPVLQRSGMMTWLAVMPLRHYQVGDGFDGGSKLFRFVPLAERPLIRRTRGALDVPLASGPWPVDGAPLLRPVTAHCPLGRRSVASAVADSPVAESSQEACAARCAATRQRVLQNRFVERAASSFSPQYPQPKPARAAARCAARRATDNRLL